MRIVLDTNVVLSALLWRGAPYHLLETIRRQKHDQLFASIALLNELNDVLARAPLSKRLALLGYTPREALSDYTQSVETVTPIATPADALRLINTTG